MHEHQPILVLLGRHRWFQLRDSRADRHGLRLPEWRPDLLCVVRVLSPPLLPHQRNGHYPRGPHHRPSQFQRKILHGHDNGHEHRSLLQYFFKGSKRSAFLCRMDRRGTLFEWRRSTPSGLWNSLLFSGHRHGEWSHRSHRILRVLGPSDHNGFQLRSSQGTTIVSIRNQRRQLLSDVEKLGSLAGPSPFLSRAHITSQRGLLR